MTDSFHAQEFIAGFIAEAEEHLGAAGKRLLEVTEAAERGKAAPRQVRELYRSLHTVKGLAAMVEVDAIVELAHSLETALNEADAAGGRLSVDGADLVSEGVRAIEARVAALEHGGVVEAAPRELLARLLAFHVEPDHEQAPPAGGDDELLERLDASEREMLEQGLEEGKTIYSLQFSPSDERYDAGVTITAIRAAVEERGELVRVMPRSVASSAAAPRGLTFSLLFLSAEDAPSLVNALNVAAEDLRVVARPGAEALPPEPAQPREPAPAVRSPPEPAPMSEPRPAPEPGAALSLGRGVVRVDVGRLDEVLERLSDLVLERFRFEAEVSALAQRGVDVRRLQDLSAEHRRHLRGLRTAIMRARTVPVAEMLERLPLLVRGLAKEHRKDVELALEPGREELDKAVADRLFPAVVHLVRNAIDHGLERPEERRAARKPEKGRLSIRSSSGTRGFLEIVVEDDGRGVDKERVAERARADLPTDAEELLQLLRRPGLSTRETANHTSGRGLGVDIAMRVIEELGGEMSLTTAAGQGSAFALRVPLSISIVEGLVVGCADQRYVIPSAVIDEIVEVDPARVITPPGGDRSGVSLMERRGVTLPLLHLQRLTGTSPVPGVREKAVVVRRRSELFAFGVDRVMAQQEVVVRRLRDPLVRVAGVVGATDLGDGRPVLVVDPVALAGRANQAEEAHA